MRWNLAVAALAASWGFVSVIVSHVELSAVTLVFWRVALSELALGLGVVVAGRVDVLKPGRHRWLTLALGAGLALHWSLYFEAIKLSSVAVAVIAVYTSPIFLALLAPLFLPERLSRVVLLAIPVALSGLIMIALSSSDGAHVRPLAVASGVSAAFVVTLLVIGQKWIVREINPIGFSFWIDAAAIVALLPVLPFSGRFLPSAGELGYHALVGVVFTAASGLVWLLLLRKVTAQAMGFLSYLEPVSAAFIAWGLLGQALGWPVLVGGALVLLAGSFVVFVEPAEVAVTEVASLSSATAEG